MGSRGPIPKRDAERRRQNKPEQSTDTVQVSGRVRAPAADRSWHSIAKRLYQSLKKSGQAQFYEPSDWAVAYLMCESLSRDLEEQIVSVTDSGDVVRDEIPLKGASLAAYLKAFAALGLTEGDRRRLRIEIDRRPTEPQLAPVSVMDEYRDALGG